MKKSEFKPQATETQTAWSWIEIMIDDHNNDYVYHRYCFQNSNNGTTCKRVLKSQIRYAKPSWSDEQEPYFMHHDRRYYLSNFIVNYR